MERDADDRIPACEVYRGVALEDQQPPERLKVVRAEIDRVLSMSDPRELFDFACDVWNAPESRQLAAAMCEAAFEISAEERRNRPAIDLAQLGAFVAGLGSRKWRSPWLYGVLPDREGVRRERPLTE